MGDVSEQATEDTSFLLLMLDGAVPMWREAITGWTPGRRQREAEEAAVILAFGADSVLRGASSYEKGDILRHPTMASLSGDQIARGAKARDYRPAEVFNALAKGIALATLVPGGITVFGRHWCGDHAACTEAASHG